MRKLHAPVVASRLFGIEDEAFSVLELHGALGEGAEAKLGALQINQNADRTAIAAFDIANGLDQLSHLIMRGVAHVDAEHIGASLEQAADHRAVRGSRAKRSENLDPP